MYLGYTQEMTSKLFPNYNLLTGDSESPILSILSIHERAFPKTLHASKSSTLSFYCAECTLLRFPFTYVTDLDDTHESPENNCFLFIIQKQSRGQLYYEIKLSQKLMYLNCIVKYTSVLKSLNTTKD